tara:strand:- start:363 stop:629 length:267 start_codon:yes stop_codon:yes gene_type:complete
LGSGVEPWFYRGARTGTSLTLFDFLFGRITGSRIILLNGIAREKNCGVDKQKVTDYLLNKSRVPAAAKARFFFSATFQVNTRQFWQTH